MVFRLGFVLLGVGGVGIGVFLVLIYFIGVLYFMDVIFGSLFILYIVVWEFLKKIILVI